MANFIPKIEYGTGPTTITFEYPPEGDNLNSQIVVDRSETRSNNGDIQSQYNFMEETFSMKFVFVSQAITDAVSTFFKTHAGLGKSFKYFEHSDEVSFFTVTLVNKNLKLEREIPDGTGGFLHVFTLSMRRKI